MQEKSSTYTKPEWWGLQEANPELNLVVAALSAGPVRRAALLRRAVFASLMMLSLRMRSMNCACRVVCR
jgi:hypothetical protein